MPCKLQQFYYAQKEEIMATLFKRTQKQRHPYYNFGALNQEGKNMLGRSHCCSSLDQKRRKKNCSTNPTSPTRESHTCQKEREQQKLLLLLLLLRQPKSASYRVRLPRTYPKGGKGEFRYASGGGEATAAPPSSFLGSSR